jgi:hypothetical protein
VTDWTIVLTTVGAAGVTAGLGYLGIRRTTEVTKEQITAETSRTREQIEAENERQLAQHREDERQHRQGTYHALVIADRRLTDAIRFGIGDAQEAMNSFSDLGNGVQIFGTESVKAATTEILASYVYVFREARKRAGDRNPTLEEIRTVFVEQEERLGSARKALLEAMSEDVAVSEA